MFWTMPTSILDGVVKSVWEGEKKKINRGVKLTYRETNTKKGYTVSNNLVKSNDKQVIHIRPSAGKSQYRAKYRTKDGKLMNNARKLPAKANWINRPKEMENELQDYWMTKQAFWLNKAFIFKEVMKKDIQY